MKKYRALVPIVLVVLMAASVYSMISGAISQKNEVHTLLKKAESCSEQGLYEKAASLYNNAIGIEDNMKYYLAVIDMYFEAGEYEACEKWCKKTCEAFPKEVQPYEKMIRVYLKQESFSKAWETLDAFDGRKLTSENIENYRRNMEFLYYDDPASFEEISQPSSDYVGICKEGSWGLVTINGANRVSPRFTKIGYYANDMIPVMDTENTWYFMGQDGEYLYNISDSVKGKVSDVGLYNNELFSVCVDGMYSYYNLEFKKQFGEYDYAGAFSGGIAAVKSGETWRLINDKGEYITKEEYFGVILDNRGICCQGDRVFVKIGEDEYIMLDSSGERIGKETVEEAKLFAGGELAAIREGKLWGFMNLAGEIVIEPRYQDANSFSANLAAVCDEGLWGYMDMNENMIIEPQYSDCFNFSAKGIAFVKDERDWSIIKLYKYNH